MADWERFIGVRRDLVETWVCGGWDVLCTLERCRGPNKKAQDREQKSGKKRNGS